MSTSNQVTYSLDFDAPRRSRSEEPAAAKHHPDRKSVPRVARLLALAIRMEGLVQAGVIRDYATVSRIGRVTRARMSQIMKLRNLSPDIQEQLLFLPPMRGLNERNLRPISRLIDWDEQRRLFQRLIRGSLGDPQ